MKIKYAKLKQRHETYIKVSAKKDLKIAALENDRQSRLSKPKIKNVDLSSYKEIFTDEQLVALQNINKEKKNDVTFVRKILIHLYGDSEVHNIPNGRARIKNISSDQAMPEEVKQMLKGMLALRLEAIIDNPGEYLFRMNKLPAHISHGLYSIIESKRNP